MSIEVITIDQRTVTYRVVSMPEDGTYLFYSLCYILHGHIRLTLDIRRNIVSYVLNDWDRFKVWTDNGTGDNYTTQEHYKSEMLKPFTYASAFDLDRMNDDVARYSCTPRNYSVNLREELKVTNAVFFPRCLLVQRCGGNCACGTENWRSCTCGVLKKSTKLYEV
ncbi:PDGFD factor, partial [Polypterus senegalus]